MHEYFAPWLREQNLSPALINVISIGAGLALTILLATIADIIARLLLLRAAKGLILRTATKWDDFLLERKVLARLARLAPALGVYWIAPIVFDAHPRLAATGQKLSVVYMILIGVMVLHALLSSAEDIYRTFDVSKHLPLKGLIQVIRIVISCLGGVIVLALLLDKTPLYLLSGLGALTAVLLIVFKDPILGFVAGIQLSANKMVAIGDWLEMPSHGADGDVIEVALTTVKIRNWDKTITTVPTYDLITRSFKNWRGMEETGGRRIKRAVHIDMGTIKLCDQEMLARFSRVQLLQSYLERKRHEVAEHNRDKEVDDSCLVNGRRLTNVGTFRAYIVAYLRQHSRIHQELTFLVRHLAPGPHGLPIEIYVFTSDTRWTQYEEIQADIFDHILAVVPEFDLRVFQEPTGQDMREGLRARAIAR